MTISEIFTHSNKNSNRLKEQNATYLFWFYLGCTNLWAIMFMFLWNFYILSGSVRHQQNSLIRTPKPVRHSLTLADTRSPKSLSLNNNDRSLTGISIITTSSTMHECDEGIVGNNSDDEDDDRSYYLA
jgi:hypothetical protein